MKKKEAIKSNHLTNMKALTLSQLIKANKFTYVNKDIITKNFPPQGKIEEVELIDFNKALTTDEAIKLLAEQGFRPATIYELLTWSQKNWNETDWIVALGSVWRGADGGRRVACLDGDASGRGLSLRWVEGDWGGVCRFAAVKKDFVLSPQLLLTNETQMTQRPIKFRAWDRHHNCITNH